jgi:hypothetical protein
VLQLGGPAEKVIPNHNFELLLTWLRRGCGVGSGHAELQFARKTIGNKVTANDTSYALAA